jgi:hypothetical protein
MATHRTAKGRHIDMGRLAAQNERVKAVGNMKVNARGDTIDSQGRILVPVNQRVSQRYQNTVTNRAANEVNMGLQRRPADRVTADAPATPIAPSKPIPVEDILVSEEEDVLLPQEAELEDDTEADEIEAIKEAQVALKPASEAPDFVKPTKSK